MRREVGRRLLVLLLLCAAAARLELLSLSGGQEIFVKFHPLTLAAGIGGLLSLRGTPEKEEEGKKKN